jgi:uncharacterized membrane protein YfcA
MAAAQLPLLIVGAFVAGVVNAFGGGGTLFSFPAAIAAGLPPAVANMSNTVALAPANLAAAWACRAELRAVGRLARDLAVPAALGGLAGGALLLSTPARVFEALVPGLIIGSCLLLAAQMLRRPAREAPPAASRARRRAALGLEFLVGVYGGYFGAGAGILNTAVLTLCGFSSIHQINALRNLLGAASNASASLLLILSGRPDPLAFAAMAAGQVTGQYMAAAFLRRRGQRAARWAVLCAGVAVSVTVTARYWW